MCEEFESPLNENIKLKAKIRKFIGKDANLPISTPNKIFNMMQIFPEMLVLDFRKRIYYDKAHLHSAISIPTESVEICDILNYNPSEFMKKYIGKIEDEARFKRRKRMPVCIVPSQNSVIQNLNAIIQILEEEDPQLSFSNSMQLSAGSITQENNEVRTQEETKTKEIKMPRKRGTIIAPDLTDPKTMYLRRLGLLFGVLLIKAFRNEKIREIYLLAGGHAHLEIRYPYLCLNNQQLIYTIPSYHYPCEIIPAKLYLGDQFHAQDYTILQNLKVTHILNVTKRIPNKFTDHGIEYCRINIEDEEETHICLSFLRVFAFLNFNLFSSQKEEEGMGKSNPEVIKNTREKRERRSLKRPTLYQRHMEENTNYMYHAYFEEEKEQNNKRKLNTEEEGENIDLDEACEKLIMKHSYNTNVILVHCAMGVSRSATLVIMYFMKKFKISFEKALAYVQSKRECVDPNVGFREQLQKFQVNKFALQKSCAIF